MVTALSSVIGYDTASAIAHAAMEEDLTLRKTALRAGVPAEEFDRIVCPETMVGDELAGA